MTKTKRRPTKPPPAKEVYDGPTDERRLQGDIVDSGDQASQKRARSISKIETWRDKGIITDIQFGAALKFQIHHYYAGLGTSPKSLNLNSLGAGTGSLPAYMTPGTETAAQHRQMFRDALRVIHGPCTTAFLAFVLDNQPFDRCASMLRPMRMNKAREFTRQQVIHKLELLSQHWGLTPDGKNV